MLQLLQTGRPTELSRQSATLEMCLRGLQKAAGEVLAERERNVGGEARLPPQADPQIRQATSNDVSEPGRYMPPNSQPPLPVEVIDPEALPNRDAPSGVAEHTAPLTPITEQYEFDEELPVEVIGPEASPNRDAPSGVAERTAPLIRITDQHESDGELLVKVIGAEASPSGVAKRTTPLNPITEQYELLTWIADAVHQAPPDQLQEQTDVSRNNVSQTAKVLTMTSDEKNCWTHSFGTFSGRASKASAANFR